MRSFLFGYDFYYLWAAGKTLEQGGNPYDVQQFNQQLAAISWPAEEIAQGLTHPPTNLWLYWLLAKLPLEAGMALLMGASLVATLACSVIISGLIRSREAPPLNFVLLSTLLFPPVLSNLIWGQVNSLLLLGLTLFAVSFRRGWHLSAGLGLSLLVFKPHNFVPFLCVITLWELSHRRIRIICGLVSGVLLQALATYLINPNAFVWYGEYVSTVVTESSLICGSTLGQMMECELGWRTIRPALLGLGTMVGLFLTAWASYSPRTLFCILLPLSLLVSPYAWNHTFIVLIPAFAYTLEHFIARHGERLAMWLLTAICLASVPLIVSARLPYLWIAMPLLLLGSNIRLIARSMHGSNKPGLPTPGGT